ncbi:MAG: InlB B-repeat-containing protein [Candidatus Heteroscillospira sp.]
MGGVAGRNEGEATITNCSNTGDVTAASNYAGGIAGYGAGPIIDCYHAGTVTAQGVFGGVAGYATGGVSHSFSYDGGVPVVGRTYDELINCYSLYAEDETKGVIVRTADEFKALELVWLLDANEKEARTYSWASGETYPVFSTEDSKAVYRVYVTPKFGNAEEAGTVTAGVGQSPELGSVAYGEAGDAYTVQITQANPKVYRLSIEGIPEDAVEEPAGTYSGALTADIAISYAFNEQGDSGWLDGEGDVYVLSTADQLVALRAAVSEGNTFAGKTIQLAANIDMSEKTFVGIGSEDISFQGTFDGQYHSISGLSFSAQEQDNQGLFAVLQDATVKNLTVSGTAEGRDNVGLLVGCAKGATVLENCTAAAGSSVTGNNNVGGIAGCAEASVAISGCRTMAAASAEGTETASVSVTAVGTAGGIVGRIEDNTSDSESDGPNLKGCVSNSAVTTTGSSTAGNNCGGIVGYLGAGGSAESCDNFGAVSAANQYAGGIAGCAGEGASFVGCKNSGVISAGNKQYIGGIAGKAVADCAFIGCINEAAGTISGSSYLGGIVGCTNGSISFTDCQNRADITGTSGDVGGILGAAYERNASGIAEFKNCVNSGSVSGGGARVGGIVGAVGQNASIYAQLTDCENSGAVNGKDTLGGIIGMAYSSSKSVQTMLVRCRNTGAVTGTSYVVGGIAGQAGGNYIVFEDCSNAGAVQTTSDRVAGIVGYNSSAHYWTISGCSNSGDITGKSADGIFYQTGDYAIIENCRNSGAITATSGAAAGIGDLAANVMRIANCYNTGAVKSTGDAAGIVKSVSGFMQDMGGIQDCYNTGRIEGNGVVAGVLGTLSKSGYQDMRYCYNTGEITAGENSTVVGGVFGSIGQYSYPSHCYNAGSITVLASSPTAVGGVVAKAATGNYNYVRYSHNYGDITVASETAADVTGAVLGGVELSARCSDLYYKENCVRIPAADPAAGAEALVPADAAVSTAKTVEQFKLAEVAYLLDNGGSTLRTYAWSQGADYPVFAASDETAVYRVSVAEAECGTLLPTGENYGVGGATMSFSIVPQEGYVLDTLTLKDADGASYGLSVDSSSVSFAMPTANTVLTATFVVGTASEQEHEVTFMSAGEIFTTIKVKDGHTMSAPADVPAREDYVFKGWYTSEDYTQQYDFNSLVRGDITLYARWVEAGSETIIVSFHLNGSDEKAPEAQTITVGGLVTRPKSPSWTSSDVGFRYQFEGWYTSRVGGQLWDFDTDQPTEDMTLWAHWTKQDAFSGGTESNPYVITTYEELKQLSANVVEGFGYGGSYFRLGEDIEIEDADWSGIGYIKVQSKNQLTEMPESGTVPFNGNFDGDGHTITLHPEQTVSVFGAIGSMGEVTNLKVSGELEADKRHERGVFGGIAGAHFGLIDSCSVELTAGEDSETYGNVSGYGGGIVGALGKGTIQNCTAKVELYKVSDEGIGGFQGACGGIVGYVVRGYTQYCTVQAGSHIYNGSGYGGGGIAGTMTSDLSFAGEPSSITGCVVEQGVTVAGSGGIGGIAGWGSLISNCRTGASVYSTGTAAMFVASPQTVGEEGVTNCYFYGSFVQGDAGTDLQPSGTFTNCYYAFVGDAPAEGSKTSSQRATYVTEAQLASGEVAYLLDGGENTHSNVWTQSDAGYPVHGTPSYYPISSTATGNGSLEITGGTGYRGAGTTVEFTATPDSYTNDKYGPQYAYVLTGVTVNGEKCEGSSFEMPEDGAQVAAVFELQQVGYNERPSSGDDSGDGDGTGDGTGGTGDGTGESTGDGDGTGTTEGGEQGETGEPTKQPDQESGSETVTDSGQNQQTEPTEPVIEEPLEPEEPEESVEPEEQEKPETPDEPEKQEDENLLEEEAEIAETTQKNNWPVILLMAVIAAAALSFLFLLLRKKKKEGDKTTVR